MVERIRQNRETVDGHAYRFFGMQERSDGKEVVARIWAPRAEKVLLVCREEDREVCFPMERDTDGVWSLRREEFPGWGYFFRIQSDGGWGDKADPYGRWFDREEPWIARRRKPVPMKWQDGEWMAKAGGYHRRPIHIYEVHVGSWRRDERGEVYSYSRLAEELIPYVKKMGYTHIELMPVTEFPYEPSWGYQVTGYFAPSSRYGRPEELMEFVQRCHLEGIGVLLDWVPAHFPRDSWGLCRMDGEDCYEDPREELNFSGWGTLPFDMTKVRVREFLIASAVFWLQEYHFDGLRLDAVAAVLTGEDGCSGGDGVEDFVRREHTVRPEGVAFLQELNAVLARECPGAMICGEDSSSYAGATASVEEGGLGFTYKWNMGWMHDTLEYLKLPFSQRSGAHERLTFPMMYAFSARHILPLSHDEVVYGKGSLYRKMPGSREEKLAGVRLLLSYMMCHPGKKLTFMGSEWAQVDEWRFGCELQWGLEEKLPHRQMRDFMAELNRVYRETPQLWEADFGWEGFRWIVVDDRENNVIAFLRQGRSEEAPLVAVLNFSPREMERYRIGVPEGRYEEVWNSDAVQFGGGGRGNLPRVTEKIPSHGFSDSMEIRIPPLSAIWFLPKGEKDPEDSIFSTGV